MRPRLPLALLLAGSAVLVVTPPALAQPRPDVPKVDASRAEVPKPDGAKPDAPKPKPPPTPTEIAQKGQELCERGDTEEAITALASALLQKPDPEIASALASCEEKTKRWAAAADHLTAALRGMAPGPTRKGLEDRLAEARGHVGLLTITVNVEGADVFVGNRFVGLTPLGEEVFADPGKNLITVKKPNYDEAERTVDVAARGTGAVKIELQPGGRSPNPYARPTRTRVPFYVLGGTGLVAAGVGAALVAAAITKGSAADDLLTELKTTYPSQVDAPCKPSHDGCSTVKSLRAGHDTFLNAGAGALIGGGVLLGVAALYGVWAFNGTAPASTGAITLAPVATPTGGGLWLQGKF